ncbi:rRNA adenine N-6-methyltransferase family protein [Ruania alba]|uniref:23S rRNA (Adenine-N6)-dimethyltransferase n=1 Tax=Ruania alba TaxID=648782 RepID=A0A1H5KV87_9MICO|nr:rRNA adenine N-6-methyltransferase family protein [Ruania alba]SEE68653.1 23S rRNA (adenine-N6)-dimethyltransferase [Ruania alba]
MSGNGQRRWGSHRLKGSWADRIVRSAGLRETDLVLDLGAGTGALTRPLARRARRVVAVELHPGRVKGLTAALSSAETVTVVHGDLLEVPLPGGAFRVVANPPYAIGAAVVRRITGPRSALVRADLVLPRWMVCRYASSPPRGFTAEVGTHVPATAFVPPPRSDSAVLVLRRRSAPRRARRRPVRRAGPTPGPR